MPSSRDQFASFPDGRNPKITPSKANTNRYNEEVMKITKVPIKTEYMSEKTRREDP